MTLNCRLKDSDETWLYGPMQPAQRKICQLEDVARPKSQMLTNADSSPTKKGILKKYTMSRARIAEHLSSTSHARKVSISCGFQYRSCGRSSSSSCDSDEGLRSANGIPWGTVPYELSQRADESTSRSCILDLPKPSEIEKKHIRFNEQVEQCIAADENGGEGNKNEDRENDWLDLWESCNSRTLPTSRRQLDGQLVQVRRIIGNELNARSGSIVRLPSTTLTHTGDSRESHGPCRTQDTSGLHGNLKCSPPLAQETTASCEPSESLQDNDQYMPCKIAGAFRGQDEVGKGPDLVRDRLNEDDESHTDPTDTQSENLECIPQEAEEQRPIGIFDNILLTTDIVKDMAYVIWNVGWN